MHAQKKGLCLVCGCILTPCIALVAQELEAMYLQRAQAVVQVNASDHYPAGLLLPGWGNYSFGAGMEEVLTGSLSDLFLTGPGSVGSWPIPHEWEGDYSFRMDFPDAEAMGAAFPPGTYTFTGMGNVVGSFTQQLTMPEYDPLAPKLVTNFNELQSFDPKHDVTIAWEPFTEAMTAPGGFIEVSIYFYNGSYDQDLWDSSGLYEEGDFGLKPEVTSVTVPAEVFQNNMATDYQVDLFFIRIDTMDSPNAFPGAILANVTSLDVLFTIIPLESTVHDVLQPGVWQIIDRIGWIFGYDTVWGYSPSLGYVYAGQGPEWVYQEHLGWISPYRLTLGKGRWVYSLALDWLWLPIPPGDGWYVRLDGTVGNMKRP